jgi:hypothetical protein
MRSKFRVIEQIVIVSILFILSSCMAKSPEPFKETALSESQHSHALEVPEISVKTGKPPTKTPTATQELTITKKKEYDEVLLSWKVPDSPVDKFIIYFGFEKQKLDRKIELSINKQKEAEDPQYGLVYQYYLVDIPADRNIYVSIMAIKGKEASKMGEVIELKAAT